MNWYGIKAIYIHEMERFRRTLFQSLASPIITTSLYFVVFGSAIGSRITEIDGINYGSYIVPGMIMLTILTQSISNASFAFYFPRFTNTSYEILAAPLSSFEIVLGFVGAAESKEALIKYAKKRDIPFITLRGRLGGSAIASAAVNALASEIWEKKIFLS